MILILELISILWVIWAFKLTETNSFSLSIDHSGNGLFSTGVCPLGKFGGWFICIWILFFITYPNPKSLSIINSIIMGIIALLALILNPPLFIRALPFFIIQGWISTSKNLSRIL